MIDYYENISDNRVVSNVEPGYLGPLLPTEAPEHPQEWSEIQADITEKIIPGLTHWSVEFSPPNSLHTDAVC